MDERTPVRQRLGGLLGVVTPLANEEATVDEFLERVGRQVGPRDHVYCVLDGASRDSTRARVEARARLDPRVRPVWAPENRSVVDAYVRGYREALAHGCDWVLEMDAGLSHLPEEIPRFLWAMSRGADFAAGSRFLPGGRHAGSLYRYGVSRGGSLLTNWLLGTRMKDMTSGFQCFRRPALEYVLGRGIRSRAHFFQTEIRFMLHGWDWVEVPITYANPSKRMAEANVVEALRHLWQMSRETAGTPPPPAQRKGA